MRKRSLIYIVSGINRAPEFEWTYEALASEFDVHFIVVGKSEHIELVEYLQKMHAGFSLVRYTKRWHFPFAFMNVWLILMKRRPNLVHAHLFEASVIGLLAAFFSGIRNRIYTRHHSDYHLRYHPSVVKYDRLCNRLAKIIVAVSKNVEELLIKEEQVPPSKIKVIHHGFDWTSFMHTSEVKKAILEDKYRLNAHSPVVGVISRFTHWKGIQHIIPAFSALLKDHPNACLVLANAQGEYKDDLMALLKTVDSRNYRLIEFESDMAGLYQVFDVFVHVPINKTAEAFGQVYLEALACQIPSVFTLSGIAAEVMHHNEHALIVPYQNSEEITKAIHTILNDPEHRSRLKQKGRELAMRFSIDKKMDALKLLYSQTFNI